LITYMLNIHSNTILSSTTVSRIRLLLSCFQSKIVYAFLKYRKYK
jgi:hypothetical protein